MAMLVRIGKTDTVLEPPTLREGRATKPIECLFNAFITDVFVEAGGGAHFRVDAFALLHGLLNGMCSIYEREPFAIQDDDFLLLGQFRGDGCIVTVSGRSGEVNLGTHAVTEAVVWMAQLVSEVARSISAEAGDFQAYLRAYPATFSYR